MAEEVPAVAQKLIATLEINMNPHVNQQQRTEAYRICEDFKENSPICAECGIYLCRKENLPVVRHFGLQLIEHCIKFRWNSMQPDRKLFIKNNAMELLASGTESVMVEQSHIKDALSRIIVEMIKREWPQQWPTLLQELNALCFMGPSQKELVLLIFLRLAEDIVAFQNVHNQRRREIYQSLTSSMKEIFAFFITTLKDHYRAYSNLKDDEKKQECRIVQTVLQTLVGYVEWVPIACIILDGNVLLQLVCLLLEDEALQKSAAECLLLIVNRKGKVEDRKPILVLFSEDAMSVIFNAAGAAASGNVTEDRYVFLKRLCQVLTGLGCQLCTLWESSVSVAHVKTFPMYLNSIVAFTVHPSQVLSGYTHSLWQSLFRHEKICEDPALEAVIPKVVEACLEKLMKVGFPSLNNSPSCEFSRMDFDDDNDFNKFYSRTRVEIVETVRCATVLNPCLTFNYGAKWLQSLLQKPISKGDGAENGFCNPNSPSALEWDALVTYLDSVQSRMMTSEKPHPSTEEGIALLKMVLNYETQDPLVLSSVLSCVSALFIFLTVDPTSLTEVLKKIFSVVVFSLPGQTKSTRDRTVRNVRRHACSSLVKICMKSPRLLLPVFEQICEHVKRLCSDPEELSQMEKCTLIEALLLINNEVQDFRRQSAFISETMAPIHAMLLSPEFDDALSSVEKFIIKVGLDCAPVQPSSEDLDGILRSQFLYCTSSIMGVVNRNKWPDDFEVARKGGFINEGPIPFYRNPASSSIFPLLEKVFMITRITNALFSQEARSKIHPMFRTALDICETEKNNILGFSASSPDFTCSTMKHPAVRMQNFLNKLHENCCHILGSAGGNLGSEFYALPGLSRAILISVFNNIEHVPDYWLRPLIRVVIKPFVQNCPPSYLEVAVIPVLGTLCPFMYTRLSEKWENFKQRYGNCPSYEEEMAESQEILDDQLNRLLTREYIDLLGVVLQNKKSVNQEIDSMEESEKQRPQSQSWEKLSELGVRALQTETICSSLVMTVFGAIHWLDTMTCLKCAPLCGPVLKQLVADNAICQQGEAEFLLNNVLLGLEALGEHDANQALLVGLGLQLYESLRPKFPSLALVLQKASGGLTQDIQSFDEKLLQVTPERQLSEKRKKEIFKKLVSGYIGKNIGQQYKRDVYIKNLRPMFEKTKYSCRTPRLDEMEKDMGLCDLFK